MWRTISEIFSGANPELLHKECEAFYETYKPIIDHHITVILESGLLLDEDYEVLIDTYDFKTFPVKGKQYSPYLKVIPSVLTTLVSVVIAKKCHLPLLVLPPAIFTLTLLYLEKQNSATKIKHKNTVCCVIKNLIKVRKFNIAIIRYMKTRAELQSTKEKEHFSMFNQNIFSFIKLLTSESKSLIEHMFNITEYLGSLILTPELEERLTELKEIELNEILTTDGMCDIEDCVKLTSRIQDLLTMFTSKVLNYLGLTLHHLINKLNPGERTNEIKLILYEILDRKLPELVSKLNSHTATCQNEFRKLKYSASKKIELRLKSAETGNKHISSKLQQTLMTSINNLSVIMERSHAVLSNVESVENADDSKEFANAIKDLRNHAYATYESLDVLCRLYGILSSSKVNDTNNDLVKKDVKEQLLSSVKKPLTNVSFNDEFEATEENYELLIKDSGNGNSDITEQSNDNDCDQSSEYLGLMLRELRQSLKKHDRFIAAKKRRGSEPDNETTINEDHIAKNRKGSPPKFDLNLINTTTQNTDNNQSLKERSHDPKQTSSKSDPQRVLASPVPPPRPPPPPPFLSVSFDMDNLLEESGHQNSRTMLDNIKCLSGQIQTKEEVFGDCDSESDEDS